MNNREEIRWGRACLVVAGFWSIGFIGCTTGPDDIPCPEGTVRSGTVCVELQAEDGSVAPQPGDPVEPGEDGGSTAKPSDTSSDSPFPFAVDGVYAPSGYMGDAINSVTTSTDCPGRTGPVPPVCL